MPDHVPEDPWARVARMLGLGSSGEPPRVHLIRGKSPAVAEAAREARRQVPTREPGVIRLLKQPIVLLDDSDPVEPLVVCRVRDLPKLAAEYVAANLSDRLEARIRRAVERTHGLPKAEPQDDSDIPF